MSMFRNWHFIVTFCLACSLFGQGLIAQTLEEDVVELNRLGKKYQMAWEKADQQPQEFVQIVREYASDVQTMKSIYQKYRTEIETKTDLGKRMQSVGKTATLGFGAFQEGASEFAAKFNERYAAIQERIRQNSQEAEASEIPGHYRSALRELETAEWMITILVAFNGDKDAAAIKLSSEVTTLKEQLLQAEKALAEKTKRVPVAPLEKYTGSDLDSLRQQVEQAWKKAHAKDKVLKVVFNHAEWKTNRLSRWNGATNEWQHVDKSSLELSVVVEKDAQNAQVYAAFVNRDNQTQAITVGVDTKGSHFVVDEFNKKELGL
jgi:hypothetical protein